MTSKTIVITGATSGLGKAATKELLVGGNHLIALVRDLEKGARMKAEFGEIAEDGKLQLVECDLSSLASVSKATKEIKSEFENAPDVLICNAGLQVVDGIQQSADGYELTMAVNILAHQKLCMDLLDSMPQNARIVMVGSETHRGGLAAFGFPPPRWKDPQLLYHPEPKASTGSQAGRVRYANSKLATIYLATELNRRFADRGLQVNTFDPGLMPETGLDRQYPSIVQAIYRATTGLIVKLPGANRTSKSAANIAWLSTSDDVNGWTNKYVRGQQTDQPSELARNTGNAQSLWQVGEDLINR